MSFPLICPSSFLWLRGSTEEKKRPERSKSFPELLEALPTSTL